jgi:hypothetical protein
MGRIHRSWSIAKLSCAVVGQNKGLLWFPAVATFFTLLAAILLLAPVALWGTGHGYGEVAHWTAVRDRWLVWTESEGSFTPRPAAYGLLAAAYLGSMFLATFFNVALYSQILAALRGERVSVGAGLRVARSRTKAILVWSLFTGIVGLLIKRLEERVGLVGRWVLRTVGVAWSVASIFVVPMIVMEEPSANPVRYLRSSAALLRRTWRESLVGYVGLQAVGVLATFVCMLPAVAAIAAAIRFGVGLASVGYVVLACLALLFVAQYVLSMAGHVYRGALFAFSSEGVPPAPFGETEMDAAWKTR